MDDPIVEEIRRRREEHAARFNDDIDAAAMKMRSDYSAKISTRRTAAS
jgi:hypothetical protein